MTPDFFAPDSSEHYPNLTEVENLLGGIGRLVFEDGTFQFGEPKHYPEAVFSPRLTEPELEEFCEQHLDQYRAFYEKHQEILSNFETPPSIERFWE